MLIKTIPVGQLETNCYIVTDENTLDCAVIDPGDESNTILDYLEMNRLKCRAVLLTHGHYDHVGAVDTIAEETGAVVYMNERDDIRHSADPHLPYMLKANGKNYDDGDVIEIKEKCKGKSHGRSNDRTFLSVLPALRETIDGAECTDFK